MYLVQSVVLLLFSVTNVMFSDGDTVMPILAGLSETELVFHLSVRELYVSVAELGIELNCTSSS